MFVYIFSIDFISLQVSVFCFLEFVTMNNLPLQQGNPMMGGMAQAPNPQMAQAPQQPPQQVQQQSQQAQEKLENISKVKSLVGPLRDSLSTALKSAAQTLHQNALVDNGTSKSVDLQDHRFNKNIEEFYSICDQIELNLKTAIECLSQNSSAMRYLPIPVMPTRIETAGTQETQTYMQFLMTVRTQISYFREVHNMLLAASHSVTSNE